MELDLGIVEKGEGYNGKIVVCHIIYDTETQLTFACHNGLRYQPLGYGVKSENDNVAWERIKESGCFKNIDCNFCDYKTEDDLCGLHGHDINIDNNPCCMFTTTYIEEE